MVSRAEAASYDRVFAASAVWSRPMASRDWDVRIEPLLQATDPDLFRPDRGGARHRPRRCCSSAAPAASERQMVQDAIEAGLPLAVYGSQWEDFDPASYVRGEFVPNDQLGALYAAAGVVLNDHWPDMRGDGFVSNRLFDAVACGARVVSDDVAGLDELFGASVQVVHDAAELGALLRGGDLDRVFGTLDGAAGRRRAGTARAHLPAPGAAAARRGPRGPGRAGATPMSGGPRGCDRMTA